MKQFDIAIPKVRSGRSFPQYLKTSVIIDYYIPKGNKAPIQLKILDANKNSVTIIVSDKKLISQTKMVEDMNLSQIFRYVDRRLEAKPGLNRFRWNLQQKVAWAKNANRRYRNGPWLLLVIIL